MIQISQSLLQCLKSGIHRSFNFLDVDLCERHGVLVSVSAWMCAQNRFALVKVFQSLKHIHAYLTIGGMPSRGRARSDQVAFAWRLPTDRVRRGEAKRNVSLNTIISTYRK